MDKFSVMTYTHNGNGNWTVHYHLADGTNVFSILNTDAGFHLPASYELFTIHDQADGGSNVYYVGPPRVFNRVLTTTEVQAQAEDMLNISRIPNPGLVIPSRYTNLDAWIQAYFDTNNFTYKAVASNGFFDMRTGNWFPYVRNVPSTAIGFSFEFKTTSTGGGNNTDAGVTFENSVGFYLSGIFFGYESRKFQSVVGNQYQDITNITLDSTTTSYRYTLKFYQSSGMAIITIVNPVTEALLYSRTSTIVNTASGVRIRLHARQQADSRIYTWGNMQILTS